jgi:hypothetical protein
MDRDFDNPGKSVAGRLMHRGAMAMKSQAADVQTYIAEVPEERRVAIKKLRILCLRGRDKQ